MERDRATHGTIRCLIVLNQQLQRASEFGKLLQKKKELVCGQLHRNAHPTNIQAHTDTMALLFKALVLVAATDVLAQAGKVYVFNAWKCNTNFDLNQSACMRVPLPDDTHTVVQPAAAHAVSMPI